MWEGYSAPSLTSLKEPGWRQAKRMQVAQSKEDKLLALVNRYIKDNNLYESIKSKLEEQG